MKISKDDISIKGYIAIAFGGGFLISTLLIVGLYIGQRLGFVTFPSTINVIYAWFIVGLFISFFLFIYPFFIKGIK